MREDFPHVEVEAPGLGEIFPGVCGGVGAHKAALPARRRAVVVVLLEGLGVGRIAVVAEDRIASVFAFAFDKRHPIVVADFVAEMANQRPVRLVHLFADALALDRVGFVKVDRDQPVGVAGEDRLVVGSRFEVELQRVFVADVFWCVTEAEVVELVEQLPFGQFELRPAAMVSLDAEVGNDVVEPAGLAEADAGERIGGDQCGAAGSTANTRLQTASTA